MLITIWNYLRGYVMIDVIGYSTERFLNLAINRDIYIWDIVRNGKNISMNVSIKGYRKLKSCARKTSCKIRIKDKVGMPFILNKYRKRHMLLIGSILFILTIYTMSLFIWTIDITGNETIQSYDVVDALSKNGVEIGNLKDKTDLRRVEEVILKQFPEVVWTGIDFVGTKMVISIKESVKEPDIIDTSSPVDIVAKSDGMILDMITRTGTPLVKKGDMVLAGDILVSSKIEVSEDGDIEYTKASADIIGKTHYIIKTKLKLGYNKKKYTGNSNKSYYIKAFDNSFNIFSSKKDIGEFDKVVTTKQLGLSSKIKLPIEIIKEERLEYLLEDKILSESDAKDKITIRLNEILNQKTSKDATVVKADIKFAKKQDEIIGELKATVQEELGQEVVVKSNSERNEFNGE